MIDIMIKYFFIIWCGIYSSSKLTNNKISLKQSARWVPITILITIIAYYLRIYIPPLNLITIYITIFALSFFLLKNTFNFSIVISVFALGVCFILYAISFALSIPIAYILFSLIDNKIILDPLIATIVGILQFICSLYLFKIKRFKKGIIAFEAKLNNDLSVFLSIVVLFMMTLIYVTEKNYYIDTLVLFITVIIGLLMYLYWKKHTTNVYQKRHYKREIDKLSIQLSEQEQANHKLKTHNQSLTRIIHRDNKLIPAMEMAVEEILNCQSPDKQKEKAEALLPQLREMSAERVGIVTEYETTNKKLPSTGIFSVDSSLKYLLKKANDKSIAFDLSVTAETSNITNKTINEDDLNTLILDLGEKAIIATSDIEHRNVLVVMGYENNRFCISFYDSGNHFDSKVISKLGIKRITTHKNTGGSGIGMMTTFELLQKYQASFILDETINSDKFTKKVSVHFDKKNEYRIQTNRVEVISIVKKRTDLIIN